METGDIIYEKENASPRPRPKISFKDNWMKELGSKHQCKNRETCQQLCASVCSTCRSRQRRRRKRRRRSNKNGRPVESEQSIGLFTQRVETDIDFRVSGLPHAVRKEAENFRVRELVKKIESCPHREALQADVQQNNAYNPFSDESKAMIREMDTVELFELCETIPKVQCSECFLYWNQGIVYCTCGHLLRENESSRHFTNGNWMCSQSRTASSKGSDLVVFGTAKLRHRNSISWPTTRG